MLTSALWCYVISIAEDGRVGVVSFFKGRYKLKQYIWKGKGRQKADRTDGGRTGEIEKNS